MAEQPVSDLFSIHTPEQLAEKQQAVYQSSREFAYRVMSGLLNEHPEMLYSEIDSLHQLLTELRRG